MLAVVLLVDVTSTTKALVETLTVLTEKGLHTRRLGLRPTGTLPHGSRPDTTTSVLREIGHSRRPWTDYETLVSGLGP